MRRVPHPTRLAGCLLLLVGVGLPTKACADDFDYIVDRDMFERVCSWAEVEPVRLDVFYEEYRSQIDSLRAEMQLA